MPVGRIAAKIYLFPNFAARTPLGGVVTLTYFIKF